ncbi:MAG: GEVED domain-containing protein [Planctomycetota bacterium]
MLLTSWFAEFMKTGAFRGGHVQTRRLRGTRRSVHSGMRYQDQAIASHAELAEPRLVLSTIPVATAQSLAVRHVSTADQTITVTYSDDVSIQAASIGTGDIIVHGPNGYSQIATLQSVSSTLNAARITATYTVTAPGGTWEMSDRGAYAIDSVASQVSDGTNFLPAGQIGSFLVDPRSTDRDGFGYRATQVPFSFTDIRTSGVQILTNQDDAASELTDSDLGDFQFPFYGSTYKNVFVSTNGLLSFTAPETEELNDDMSSLSLPIIAGLWDNLETKATGIRWQVTGTGNQQVLTIQWDAASYFGSAETISFQIILEEAGGAIQFNYADLSDVTSGGNGGASATVGIRDAVTHGNRSLLISQNAGPNDFVGTGRSIRIEPDFDGRWMPVGPFSASNGQTENLSPNRQVAGAIHTLLAHPTNPNILWAGAVNGGVWRTDNATSANPYWRNLTDAWPSQSIGSMAFDLADATRETVYAGVGRYSSYAQVGADRTGVWRTRNGGQTWEQLSQTLLGKNIAAIHANGNTIVVAVNTADVFGNQNIGIWRSTDSGATFTQISTTTGGPSGLPGGVTFDMFTDPNDSNVLFTSVAFPSGGAAGVYKSTDQGATWTLVSNATMNALFTNGTSNVELTVGQSHEVYVAIINTGTLAGLFRSGDAGNTWTQMDRPSTNENGTDVGLNPSGGKGPGPGSPPEAIAGGQGNLHFSIVADPTNPDLVYVGGDRQPRTNGDTGTFPNSIGANDFSGRLFRGDATRPLGSQFVHLTHSRFLGAAGGGTLSSSAPHADSREMVFDANGNLIEADDGGVYRRTQPQSNLGDWFGIAGNMQVTEAHDADWDSFVNAAISGNQDTGTTQQTTPGNSVWNSIHTGDGGDVLVVEGPSSSVRYSSFQNLGGFRKTTYDASGNVTGLAFPQLTVTSGNALARGFRTPIAANKRTGALYIQGTNGIYESFNEGTTIAQLSTSSGSAGTSNLGQSAIVAGGMLNGVPDDNILWVGASNRVYLRSAAGGNLVLQSSLPAIATIRDLTINSRNWQQSFVIDDNQVVMTSDAGTSWVDITGNLMSFTSALRTVSFVATPLFDAIVVGTHNGIYLTPLNNYGTPGEWIRLGLDMPNVVMFDMEYDVTDDVLIAGTMGRGVWMLHSVQDVVMETLLDFDYGDAPESYEITKRSQGGRHVATGVTLGTRRDFEADAVPTADASGDDANNLTDDEDGVTFLTPFQSGHQVQVRVNVSEAAFLSMLVDLDLNGKWDDAGGEVISAASVTAGNNDLTFSLPAAMTSVPVTSWVRILVTTDSASGNHGAGAPDGEVEDYQVTIFPEQAVIVTVNPNSISENGGTSVGTVSLSLPDAVKDTTIQLSSSDTSEATVPLTVVIPAGQTSATFPITAVDDTLLDGTQVIQITGSLLNALSIPASLSVTDQELLLLSINNPTFAENGGLNVRTATITRGNTDISNPVVVTLISGDPTELTVPLTVQIPANAASTTFGITAVDDLLVDGTILASLTAQSSGYVSASSAVNVLDDESSTLIVTESGGSTSVSEAGLMDTVTVALSQAPLADVVVSVSVSMISEFTPVPSMLTFTPANWNVAQIVTLLGQDDVFVDGTRSGNVVFSVVDLSSDILFINAPDVATAITNTDNEVAGLVVTESGGTTTLTEANGADTVTVRLINRPLSDVVFSVSVTDLTEATATPSSLRFTTSDWDIPQTISLSSVDDNFVDGNILSHLVISVRPSQSNDAFDLLSDSMVAVTTLDNETAGLFTVQSNGSTSVSENGTTDTIQVRLIAPPVSNVVFTVQASNTAEATVAPATITFTPQNWNVLQTITVTGVDDLLFDKTQTSQITIAVDPLNSQDAFDSLVPTVISVSTLDNEPDPPTVTGPAIDTRTSLPTFTWTAVPGAVNYEIYVLSLQNPSVRLINTVVSGTSYTSPIQLDIARHRVWVRANLLSGVSTPWSFPRTFDVRTPPTIQPIARFQDSYRPTISWTAPVPNVASYQIQIDSRFKAPFGLVMESGITTTSYTLKTDLPLGLYRVWVRAFTVDGQFSAWSSPGEFFIAVAPTGTAPPPSTFDTPPPFRWSRVQGGRAARLRLFDTTTRQLVIDQGGLKNPEFTPTVPLRPGLHRWNVQAVGDNAVVGLWSVGYQLYVGGRTTITPPGCEQGSSTPTIRWDAVEGVFTYSLYMVRNGSSAIRVDHLTTNSYTPSAALAAGNYRIWVQAVSTTGQLSPWSLPIDITIAEIPVPVPENDDHSFALAAIPEPEVSFRLVSLPVPSDRQQRPWTDNASRRTARIMTVHELPPDDAAQVRIQHSHIRITDEPMQIQPLSLTNLNPADVVEGVVTRGLDAVLADWNRLDW